MSDAADSIGSMATAGLIAREIERAHCGAPAIGHTEDEPCANCGAERVGPFCHRCGQAGHVHKNLMALVHDLAHGVFHFEGKIWKTLPMLAWRPGELTRRYVDGERVKFVSPMALFLFSVFLMFAVVSNLAHTVSPHVDITPSDMRKLIAQQQKFATRIATYKTIRATLPEGGNGRKQMDEKIADAETSLKALQLPAKVRAMVGAQPAVDTGDRAALEKNGFGTGIGWLDGAVGHIARNPELATYKMKSYAYKYSWALIPISLPFIWLLFFWRRDVGFYDHAIFSIYSLSFMSLAVVVLSVLGKIGLPSAAIVLIVLCLPPIHMYRQLKGAYRLGRWGAGWRTVALLFITTITLSLFASFLFWMGTD